MANKFEHMMHIIKNYIYLMITEKKSELFYC